MPRCGIVTLTCGENYGNRLQNYALQQIIKKYGYEPETILYDADYPSRKTERHLTSKLREWQSLRGAVYDLERIMRKRFSLHLYPKQEQARRSRFEAFSREHIRTTGKAYGSRDDLAALDSKYDVFLAGSDQIWNPYYEGVNPFYFLDFAERRKRIAYASSFGVSDIPPEQRPYYSRMLSGLDAISVREERGREIVEGLTGKSVRVLPDPTMLLTGEEWAGISKKPENRPEAAYLLTYFLGKETYALHRAVAKLARDMNLPVLALNNPCCPAIYDSGPAEFLDLLRHAALVCTDSFHGCIFSLLFGRPFVIFDRAEPEKKEAMNSRIETLKKDFAILPAPHINDAGETPILSRVNDVLAVKREAAFRYLKEALEGIRKDEKT